MIMLILTIFILFAGRYFSNFIEELEDDKFHYLVTEYCGSDMFSVLMDIENELRANNIADDNKTISVGRLTEDTGRIYFTQLVEAIAFLHSNHIIHMDLSAFLFSKSSTDKYPLG